MCGAEGRLLHICKVVFRISVKGNFADSDQGIIAMGPDLGDIENVPFVLETIFEGHDLDIEGPGGTFAGGNMVEKISSGKIWVFSFQFGGRFQGEVLNADVSLNVNLDPELVTLFIDPLVGVATITIHMSETIRSTSVTVKDGNLVD
jgi:hypothetical protein